MRTVDYDYSSERSLQYFVSPSILAAGCGLGFEARSYYHPLGLPFSIR